MSDFTFNGVSASSLGLVVSGEGVFDGGQRLYDEYTVPGLSGTVAIPTGAFSNVSVSYNVRIKPKVSLAASMQALRDWLLLPEGYCTLSDTYNTDIVRLAKFSGNFEATVGILKRYGEAYLTFDCKPQRYNSTGYNLWIDVSARQDDAYPLVNSSKIVAKPLYRVTFGGTDDTTITIQKLSYTSEVFGSISFDESVASAAGHNTVIYDSELDYAYYEDGSNANAAVEVTGDVTLPPNSTRYVWQDSQNDADVQRREWSV